MPLATEAYHGDNKIGVAKALEIRAQFKGRSFKTCLSCRRPVKPHKEGGGASPTLSISKEIGFARLAIDDLEAHRLRGAIDWPKEEQRPFIL